MRLRQPKIPAEERLEARRTDHHRLLHELELHKLELEIQNEELLAARLEAEVSLERYASLFEFAPVGYAILDLDLGGTILEINRAGSSLLARQRRHLVGLAFEGFVVPDAQPTFRAFLDEARRAETRTSCEIELLVRGGAGVHAGLTASVLIRTEPQILLAFVDITERIEREQRLARAEQALRDADRRKNEFLAVLSHELRNPLAPIGNSLRLLENAEANSEQARRALAIIDRQFTLLTRLVDDLLDVARIGRGKIELQCDRAELGELVRRTLEDHRMGFEASGIRLEGRVEPGAFWVNADAARLVQALSNVLGNAEKFTPRGGTVAVSLEREPECRIALRVRDTGAGIAPDVLPHVFDSFVQAHQTIGCSRGGLGLGLAMVKELVELHGGSVAIASEGPGKGTEVAMFLPGEIDVPR